MITAEELEKLAELKEKGIITEEDFNAKRDEFLNKKASKSQKKKNNENRKQTDNNGNSLNTLQFIFLVLFFILSIIGFIRFGLFFIPSFLTAVLFAFIAETGFMMCGNESGFGCLCGLCVGIVCSIIAFLCLCGF